MYNILNDRSTACKVEYVNTRIWHIYINVLNRVNPKYNSLSIGILHMLLLLLCIRVTQQHIL